MRESEPGRHLVVKRLLPPFKAADVSKIDGLSGVGHVVSLAGLEIGGEDEAVEWEIVRPPNFWTGFPVDSMMAAVIGYFREQPMKNAEDISPDVSVA